MANKNLFKSTGSSSAPVADAVNNAGGVAYNYSDRHCLAQIAATNCFNGTFYVSAEDNLKLAKEAALKLVNAGDHEFVAKVAMYSRDKGYMKDMPAFLTVVLAGTNKPLFRKVFRKVVDNGKMLRNVIQMARSGVINRKFNMSAGTWRNATQEWFNNKSPWSLFKASIGNDPSMRDILRMCRPKPNSSEKEALFGYFLGKENVSLDSLPEVVRAYELYKLDKSGPVPDVDFRMLDSLGLGDKEWTEIARKAPWTMTRMNLNTFARHGVFKDKEVTKLVADRLANKEEIAKARAFPYQLYVAWREVNGNDAIPFEVKNALQDAMETAIDGVPAIGGKGFVCVDCSGSMSAAVTGNAGYGRVTSSVTCSEVAGLIASAVIRKNGNADVYTFDSSAKHVKLNPRDTVLTNTKILAKAGGGTNISAPLRDLNAKNAKGDWVFYISDNESWLDRGRYGATALATEWAAFKKRNPKARLICCDLTPSVTSQIKGNNKDVLQVGGFSDQVFNVVASFVEHGDSADHWVSEIEKISLD